MLGSMLVLALILNFNLFDNYFSDVSVFFWSTLVTFIILVPAFIFYGMIAISLRNRFPNDSQTIKRVIICIGVFLLLSAVVIAFLLLIYETVHFLDYEFSEDDYTNCYLATIVMNIFLTFLNEGISQFERYKITLIETEQLKKEYLQSQLLGLKSQMNPHFLFNSLNTLSCLIQEDEEKAEDFLDHMSKLYRYLLRNNEDHLVNLRTEIDMVRSYYFLLKKRHSDALILIIDIPEKYFNHEIPPLTLQMIIENAVNQNSLTKIDPLNITVKAVNDEIEIQYNKQPKLYGTKEGEEAIDNIANKFRLLTQREIEIVEETEKRIIRLPLLGKKEPVAV
jgi:two-component system, LytTR family, sensor kinase